MQKNFQFSEIESLAADTFGQRLNDRWEKERLGRILASSMRDTIELGHELPQHNMTKSSKLSEKLLKKIRWRRQCLYNLHDFSYREAVQWGLEKERIDRTTYAKRTGYRDEQTGLWVFPSGSLCCTPD